MATRDHLRSCCGARMLTARRRTRKTVMNLSLIDAFSRFGAKPASRLGSLSAMATDGAMVLNCLPAHFGHPAPGVLRYEMKLSTAQAESKVVTTLGEHLTRARDADLPVRMVVTFPDREKSGAKPRSYHVRPDLIGKVVEFDGDRFVVDFTRPQPLRPAVAAGRRK
ncbi:MAG: hypothetical protein ACRETZ_00665 [Steroidobacteraceae bacterium]